MRKTFLILLLSLALAALFFAVGTPSALAASDCQNDVEPADLPTKNVWDPNEHERRDITEYSYEELESFFAAPRFATWNDLEDVCTSIGILWDRVPSACSGYVPVESRIVHPSLAPPTSRRAIDYAQAEFTIKPYDPHKYDGLPPDYPDKVLIEQPPRATVMRRDRYIYDQYRIDPFGYDEWGRQTGVRSDARPIVIVDPAYPPWAPQYPVW
jgi:hypothetical protein